MDDSNALPQGKYVDLGRTFRRLENEPNQGDRPFDVDRGFHRTRRLAWNDLLRHKRVVILAEAGAGKTEEIRHVACKLKAEGKAAFFLRLENVADHFDDAFEVGTREGFDAWLQSDGPACILLDSIDEARLKSYGDFDRAIRKIGRLISGAGDRAQVVITGRVTAWRPMTDLLRCAECLPCSDVSEMSVRAMVEDDHGNSRSDSEARAEPPFLIVALNDLESEQIERFVAVNGIRNAREFLREVDTFDAWSFTSRPQDLEELVAFWRESGRIGSRLELMRHSVQRRLLERDAARSQANPMSSERAFEGACLLAVAATLGRQASIKIPDSNRPGGLGISAHEVLPGWNEQEIATLLSRPIFDPAVYGTARFHHRTVREFLAAEWFRKRLDGGSGRLRVQRLLLPIKYGVEVIPPSLRGVVVWLVLHSDSIRERVRRISPELFFEGGDPRALPKEFRRNVLKEACRDIQNGSMSRVYIEPASTQRFAGDDLTDDVEELFREYAGASRVTEFIVGLVRYGRLHRLERYVLAIAGDPKEDPHVRVEAVRAAQALGTDLQALRLESLAEPAPNRMLLAILLASAGPSEETVDWLCEAAQRSQPNEKYTFDGFEAAIERFLGECEPRLQLRALEWMNSLVTSQPVIASDWCPISKHFSWLLGPLASLAVSLVEGADRLQHTDGLLEALQTFSHAHGSVGEDLGEPFERLAQGLRSNRDLNARLFWHSVACERRSNAQGNSGHSRVTSFWEASTFRRLWSFDSSDFDRLMRDARQKAYLDDKLVALSLVLRIYRDEGEPSEMLAEILTLRNLHSDIADRIERYLTPVQPDRAREEEQERRAERSEERRRNREKYHADWLLHLTHGLDHRGQEEMDRAGVVSKASAYIFNEVATSLSKWSNFDISAVAARFGQGAAEFFERSARRIWRNYLPALRSDGVERDGTPYVVSVGIIGIALDARAAADWPNQLTPADVGHATRYALHEINGFPWWLPLLAAVYPEPVARVLAMEAVAELRSPVPNRMHFPLLNDLVWHGQWAWPLVAPDLVAWLNDHDVSSSVALDEALRIVSGAPAAASSLATISRKRIRTAATDQAALWLAAWTAVEPKEAINAVASFLEGIPSPGEQTRASMIYITALLGNSRRRGHLRDHLSDPSDVGRLYMLMSTYIRRSEDIDRAGKGVYSPGLRDDAQDARGALFEHLNQMTGKPAFVALQSLAGSLPDVDDRPWMRQQALRRAELDSESDALTAAQVREFCEKLEVTPRTHAELNELTIQRFLDLKDDLEHGDASLARILMSRNLDEPDIRLFLSERLTERAAGRYWIAPEEELADGKKPDIRVRGRIDDLIIPVELKLADRWSGPKLMERFENQLCFDYLRGKASMFGVFVLVYRGYGRTKWRPPGRAPVDFPGLIVALRAHWKSIASNFPLVDDVSVIGIDLTLRAQRARAEVPS